MVIWYNPSLKELSNLKAHLDHFDDFIVVDNSDVDNSSHLKDIDSNCNVKYISLNENKGIAAALNIGCQYAIDLEYKWILTLDQDSTFEDEQLERYFERFREKSLDPTISLFASSRLEDLREGDRTLVITSGNILSLSAFQKVEGFDEDLFIDEVDFDMCFKLKQNGYRIYQFKDVILTHNLGENYHERMLFKKKVRVMNHSALRKYYIFRNRLVVRSRYPQHKALYTSAIKLFFLTTMFFEKQRLMKLLAFGLGYIDYKLNRMGKCRYTFLIRGKK